MSKFLRLCEEYSDSTNQVWALKDFLESKGIKVSLVRGTNTLYIDTGTETIAVDVSVPEEEAESISADYGDYDVNNEVENLAGKAQGGLAGIAKTLFGNSAQQAKRAVQQRQGVVKQAVGVYDKKTKKLQSDLKNIQI